MILVVAIFGIVAVGIIFAQRNDGVVGIVTVLLVKPGVDNTGNQRAVFRAQQVVHHTQEILLVDFQIRDRRFWPDDQLGGTHMRLRQIQIGFQRIHQLVFIPFQRLGNIALHQRYLGCPLRQQLIPLDVAQREGQRKQHDGGNQRFPAALNERKNQQAANHHQNINKNYYILKGNIRKIEVEKWKNIQLVSFL